MSQYIIAEGLAGLEQALNKYVQDSQAVPGFSNQKHFLLYQNGQQQSLIKIDMSQPTWQIWYADKHSHRAPKVISDICARYGTFIDLTQQENARQAAAFRSGQVDTYVPPAVSLYSLPELEEKLKKAESEESPRQLGATHPKKDVAPREFEFASPLRSFAKFAGFFSGRVGKQQLSQPSHAPDKHITKKAK